MKTLELGNYKNPINSYTYSKNKPTTDWGPLLKLSYAKQDIETLANMKSNAGDWVTCACGNTCRILPRKGAAGEPEDEELSDLGMVFYKKVHAMYFSFECKNKIAFKDSRILAIETLKKIEARSLFLIDEILEPLSPIQVYTQFNLLKPEYE
jgi:hypothetical protein